MPPPCPVSKCCPTGCNVCGYAASHTGFGSHLAHGTVTIKWRNFFGGTVGTSTSSYSPPQTEVCFSPGALVYYDYLLTATSSDDATATGYVDSASSTCGVIIDGCPCTNPNEVPSTLYVHVSDQTKNYEIFQPATLVYQTTPAALRTLSISDMAHFSTTSFSDLAEPTETFWYYFLCYGGYYMLTRVYLTYRGGGPHRDIFRYQYLATTSPNTCSPFSLTFGTIFSGADTSETVSIDSTYPP